MKRGLISDYIGMMSMMCYTFKSSYIFMTIEQLNFTVPPEFQSKFIEIDEKVWTRYFSKFDFFVSKEIWTDIANPNTLSVVIHWASLESWKSISKVDLDRLAKEFDSLCMEQCQQVFEIKGFVSYEVTYIANSNQN
jgi:uncharacterized protein (TIGR03792 family)